MTQKILVNELLSELENLFKTKNKDYGDAYTKVGEILKIIYPVGIHIESAVTVCN